MCEGWEGLRSDHCEKEEGMDIVTGERVNIVTWEE